MESKVNVTVWYTPFLDVALFLHGPIAGKYHMLRYQEVYPAGVAALAL